MEPYYLYVGVFEVQICRCFFIHNTSSLLVLDVQVDRTTTMVTQYEYY